MGVIHQRTVFVDEFLLHIIHGLSRKCNEVDSERFSHPLPNGLRVLRAEFEISLVLLSNQLTFRRQIPQHCSNAPKERCRSNMIQFLFPETLSEGSGCLADIDDAILTDLPILCR